MDKQSCCECNTSVKIGSGNFVNRIPVLASYDERKDDGRPYPEGAFVCYNCDETRDIKKRLEYLRKEIQEERISYGEVAELQGLAEHIAPDDVELLQWVANE